MGLIDQLTSTEFNPENHKDEYRIRALAMLDEREQRKRGNHFSAGAASGKVVEIWKP